MNTWLDCSAANCSSNQVFVFPVVLLINLAFSISFIPGLHLVLKTSLGLGNFHELTLLSKVGFVVHYGDIDLTIQPLLMHSAVIHVYQRTLLKLRIVWSLTSQSSSATCEINPIYLLVSKSHFTNGRLTEVV
jgi:hypothetical protein